MALYVQYGCGTWVPDGWLNFDVTPTARIQKIPLIGKKIVPMRFPDAVRYGDICKGLPVKDGSVDGVYCSHVLEHLALEDMKLALKNTRKMLRPGGIFRLVLPDLKLLVQAYISNPAPDAAVSFVESLGLGRRSHPRGLMNFLRGWLGNSGHHWMWDYQSLALELSNAGFISIRRAVLGDSNDLMFARAEQPIRWEDALGIHCQRTD
jgi:predicted SAM-dependent methyltransferase